MASTKTQRQAWHGLHPLKLDTDSANHGRNLMEGQAHNENQSHQDLNVMKEVVGLQNLHNSCFFNSVLQCLIQCQPLSSYFLSSSSEAKAIATTCYEIEKETVFQRKEKNKRDHPSQSNGSSKSACSSSTIASSYASFLRSVVNISHSGSTNNKKIIQIRNRSKDKGGAGVSGGGIGGIGVGEGSSKTKPHHNNKTAAAAIQHVNTTKTKTVSLQMSPIQLFQTVKKVLTLFNNYNQHDPHEFCSFFVTALHDDLNRCITSNNNNGDANSNGKNDKSDESSGDGDGDCDHTNTVKSIRFWNAHLQRNDSIIVDHFQGLLQNHIHCPKCSFTSTTFDIYSMLSLPIVPLSSKRNHHHSHSYANAAATTMHQNSCSISIEECIGEFNKSSILDDCNTWCCPKCKDHVNAKQRIQLWTLPNILIFHLKRFSNSGEKKNQQQVVFPIETHLDMKSFVFGPTTSTVPNSSNQNNANDASFQYKLFGVCNHEGQSVHRGHYTSIIRSQNDNQWYKCNDSKVEAIHYTNNSTNKGDANQKTTNNSSTPYLLFYERCCNADSCTGRETNNSGSNSSKRDYLHYLESMKWGGMKQFTNGNISSASQDSENTKFEPPTDDDGFTLVVSKKNRKKNR